MQGSAFVEAYPRTFPLYEELLGQPPDTLSPEQTAMAWGYRFGKLLHDGLSGRERDVFATHQEFINYARWSAAAPTLDSQLALYGGTAPEAAQFGDRNRLNFHSLNRSLLAFWSPLIDAPWAEPQCSHSYLLQLAQDALTFEACCYFLDREEVVKQGGGTHALFEPTVVRKNEQATGVIQEFDAAIMILEAMRRKFLGPNTVVVPAPPQFALTDVNLDVNLIVVDTERRHAVGIQVESQMASKPKGRDIRQADAERVVFIDGNVDLNNVRWIRHNRASSREQPTAWPGIIAARRMCDVILKGDNITPPIRESKKIFGLWHPQTIQALQGWQLAQAKARRAAGHFRVDFKGLAQLIGERIDSKL